MLRVIPRCGSLQIYMSYFHIRFGSDQASQQELEAALAYAVPIRATNDTIRLELSDGNFVAYKIRKAIRDIVIHDDKRDSWVALIGTPLAQFRSKQEEQRFLADFLVNPTKLLQQQIDGNFAVFSYDAGSDTLLAATDFNNTIPIYYSVTPGGVLLSSHELPLARALKSEIDPFGFCQSINLGVTWGSRTRFSNISKLLACQILRIDRRNEPRVETYWQPRDEAMWPGTFDEQLEKWMALLERAVSQYYECSDRKPVLADFTAGEDSRLILAQCHALRIPFTAHVTGLDGDVDVTVAKRAASKAGFELLVRQKHWITSEQLLSNATSVVLDSDAYREIFTSCTEFATDRASPIDDYSTVKYCGAPGGEAFRGSYYLRGKALSPSSMRELDYAFFLRMKFLLDFQPGLLAYPGYSDSKFLRAIQGLVKASLEDVTEFPIGIQIDHLLRDFQTCFIGLKYKNPLYLPLATSRLTRAIYGLSPSAKQGGKLTKACTELLFPELALVKTQNGVPTIRPTLLRLPLFIPEHLSVVRKLLSGIFSRYLKLGQANKWYYRQDLNAYILTTLLKTPPYSNWFSASHAMTTGYLYNSGVLDPMLEKARRGDCRNIPVLGRIVNEEIAMRWVLGGAQ